MDIPTGRHIYPLKKQQIGWVNVLEIIAEHACYFVIEVYPYFFILKRMLSFYCACVMSWLTCSMMPDVCVEFVYCSFLIYAVLCYVQKLYPFQVYIHLYQCHVLSYPILFHVQYEDVRHVLHCFGLSVLFVLAFLAFDLYILWLLVQL